MSTDPASRLPKVVATVLDVVTRSQGVVAVTLGGSRSTGEADEASDWDLGVFYRGDLDLGALAELGTVHPPGSWGRFMNGGAWLAVDGVEIDVILRDLDVVEDWSTRARRGDYEVDQLLGYLAGFPSYTLLAEVASSVVLTGALQLDTTYPEELAREAAGRWGFQRDFTLDYARMHARRGDATATIGNLARAAMEEAHRRMADGRRWVLNEKRLLAKAGLHALPIFDPQRTGLEAFIDDFVAALSD